MFKINREAIFNHPRVTLINDVVPIDEALDNIEQAINVCYTDDNSNHVVQHGRVIALRATDWDRLSSAFKAGLYLGKYDDMNNVERFLNKMVKAGHSYEPIRGENILFLFIGVGKPVYDHLITYSVGRPTRIAGGQRANLPWGYEVPSEVKGDMDTFMEMGTEAVRHIVDMTKGLDEETGKQQIQVARSLLPVGYIMPPFLLEFTEEALVKTVFKQRIWEKGAQGATVDIVSDMFECVMQIDHEKWETLFDYHGPHTARWEKAMRTLRDKNYTIAEFLDLAISKGLIEAEETEDGKEQHDLMSVNLYDVLLETVGKLPLNMWEKKK